MTDWMGYEAIVTARGRTRRDRIINQARDHLERTAPDQPSYTKCLVDGHEVNMLIMGGDTADQKKFRVMPTDNHYVTYGNIVEWSNSRRLRRQHLKARLHAVLQPQVQVSGARRACV